MTINRSNRTAYRQDRGANVAPPARKAGNIGDIVMRKLTLSLVIAAVLTNPMVAQAVPNCTSEPKEKWMSEQAMKAKVAELGYERVKTFTVSGSCYEIYGYTKDGKKAEVYFNPVTGNVVKSNIGG
jgi:hypothetical protein